MEHTLLNLEKTFKPLIKKAKDNNEMVSIHEGEVTLTLSLRNGVEITIFSNLLWGGRRSWFGNELYELIDGVEKELKEMIGDELSLPRSFLVDI